VFKKEKLAVGCQGILVVVQIKKKAKTGRGRIVIMQELL
jgi:hypothetical protein